MATNNNCIIVSTNNEESAKYVFAFGLQVYSQWAVSEMCNSRLSSSSKGSDPDGEEAA